MNENNSMGLLTTWVTDGRTDGHANAPAKFSINGPKAGKNPVICVAVVPFRQINFQKTESLGSNLSDKKCLNTISQSVYDVLWVFKIQFLILRSIS